MVLHAGVSLCREQVAARRGEELQDVVVGPRGRVGHVHHRVRTGQGVGETFTGDRVDTRAWRGGDRLVAELDELGDDL